MGRWRHPRGAEAEDRNQGVQSAPVMLEAPPGRTPEDAGEEKTETGVVDGVSQVQEVSQEVSMERADGGSELSVVGPGTRIEGTVTAAGSLRVDGEVKGKITAAKEVTLSPQGRVEANIQATSITLAGRVKGDLVANGDVSLPADSRLDGDIQARNVVVGGVVMGDIVGKGKVELGPHARVEGDIRSQALAIAEGAVFIGISAMGEEAHPDGGGKA